MNKHLSIHKINQLPLDLKWIPILISQMGEDSSGRTLRVVSEEMQKRLGIKLDIGS